MEKRNTSKLHVLITGGSSGLGLELAKIYASRGACLFIVSKPLPELEAAKPLLEKAGAESVLIYQQDLTEANAAKQSV